MTQERPQVILFNTAEDSTSIVPASESQIYESQPADCRVKWLEIVALSLGGIGLIGAAIVGLGHKLMINMQDSYRVEKIAKHIVRYQFPQSPPQGTGTIGLSIGAEAFAVISDRPSDPKLRLFVQKSPVDPVERTAEFVREMGLTAAWSGSWEEGMQTQMESFTYCAQETELDIRKGNWIEARQGPGQEVSVPAIEYTLSATIKQHEQTIRILATGVNAEKQAQSLLRSIQCRG